MKSIIFAIACAFLFSVTVFHFSQASYKKTVDLKEVEEQRFNTIIMLLEENITQQKQIIANQLEQKRLLGQLNVTGKYTHTTLSNIHNTLTNSAKTEEQLYNQLTQTMQNLARQLIPETP